MDFAIKTAEQMRQQIRALRKRLGMTQAQLGQALGVSQARVVEIEAQPGSVSLQQVMQALHALGAGFVVRVEEPPAGNVAKADVKSSNAGAVQSGKRGSW